MSLKQPRQKVLMNTNKTPSIVGWMRFIASSIHFITILKLCTARLQRLSHTRASRSSPSFLFELYSTLKASFTMHECTSFSLRELCSDSWKEEGCLEKEGETMREKWKLSDSIMSIAIYSFLLFILYIFFTIIPLCLSALASRSSTVLNGSCVGLW